MDIQNHRFILPRIVIIFIILGAIGLVGGIGVGWYISNAAVVARQEVIKKVPFQTYTATAWPDGFVLDNGSTAYDNDAYVFTLSNANGGRISVSQQKRPDDAKLALFMERYLPRKQEVAGAPYKSWISDFPPGGTILGVEAEDTWIVVTTTKKQANTQLQEVAKKLQKS